MNERKGMYLSGQVPIEDDTFKKLLLHNVQYIKRVDHFLTHMDQNPQKSLTLNQLLHDRRDHAIQSSGMREHKSDLQKRLHGVKQVMRDVEAPAGDDRIIIVEVGEESEDQVEELVSKRPRVPKKEMNVNKSKGKPDGGRLIDDLELDFDQIPDYEQTKSPQTN
jgi:hypothetical protein